MGGQSKGGGPDRGCGVLGSSLGRGAGARHLRGRAGQSRGWTEVVQQLLGPVLCGPQLEQIRVLVDELGVHDACQELLVVEHILQEGDVGLRDRGGWEGVTVQQGQERRSS